MVEDNKFKEIVILGMHRSGTSMTSGILSRLGVNMGDELIGKAASNPLGHFEDKSFVDLNDKILESAGGSWDNPPSREEILVQEKKYDGKIAELIEGKKNNNTLWGWKDPRTSLTIDLYCSYLENPYFIVCHRNSEDVAQSLYKRNKMDIEEGKKLRQIYEKRIDDFFEKHSKSLRRLDVQYENVIDNPSKHIKKIIDFLDLEVKKENYNAAVDFVLPKDKLRNLSNKIKLYQIIKKPLKKILKLLK